MTVIKELVDCYKMGMIKSHVRIFMDLWLGAELKN